MSRPWHRLLAACMALAACGPGAERQLRECAVDGDCPADAYCLQGACAADIPPVAAITGPSTAKASTEVVFDGSESSDADDAVASYSWAVVRKNASCDVVVPTGSAVKLAAVFGCAGDFAVRLVVTDSRGVPSAPAERTVKVAPPDQAPPTLAMGTDLVLQHQCRGTPLRCEAVDADGRGTFQVVAHGTDHSGKGTLRYDWAVELPAGLATAPRVTFTPDASTPTPAIAIATDGTAIAGDYRFVATVRDDAGLVARGVQLVKVANRPPVVTGGAALAVPHLYDPVARLYRAGAVAAPSVEDPDGDPVAEAWSLQASAPTGCSFGFAPSGAPHLELACAAPSELIGEVRRTIVYRVRDANGAEASTSWDLSVTNRPPVIAPILAALSFPHGVDDRSAPTRFVVDGAVPFAATDPDGDPLGEVEITLAIDGRLTSSSVGATYTNAVDGLIHFSFSTPVEAPLEFRNASGGSPFSVAGRVRDPWAASAPAGFAVLIENRAPVAIGPSTLAATVSHAYDGAAYVAGAELSAFQDPDGDPLVLLDDSGDPLCKMGLGPGGSMATAAASCRLAYAPSSGGAPPLARLLGARPLRYRIADPWHAEAPGSGEVTVTDRPPTVALPQDVSTSGVESCVRRVCGRDPDGRLVYCLLMPSDLARVAPLLGDPDGDPLVVAWSAGVGSCGIAPASAVCLPAACAAATLSTCAGIEAEDVVPVAVSVSDGVLTATAETGVTASCR